MATSNWQQKRPGPDDSGAVSATDTSLNREDRAASAGVALRQAREEMGWSTKQVGQSLKIRSEYLDAFERNSLEGLPGPAYAMGFLKTYADFLGLDTNEIVRRFKAEKSGLGRRPELTFPVPLTDRGIPGGGLFLIALILIALGYGTWYYMSSGRHSTPPAVEAVPSQLLNPPPADQPSGAPGNPAGQIAVAPVTGNPAPNQPNTSSAEPPNVTPPLQAGAAVQTSLLPSTNATSARSPSVSAELVAPAGSATPVSPAPSAVTTASSGPTASSGTPVSPGADAVSAGPHNYGLLAAGHVTLHANTSTWVQVKENGAPIFTRVLKAGDSYNVPDRPGLVMRTGNAGGIEITVDGKAMPPLGAQGQVKGNIQLDPAKLISASGH